MLARPWSWLVDTTAATYEAVTSTASQYYYGTAANQGATEQATATVAATTVQPIAAVEPATTNPPLEEVNAGDKAIIAESMFTIWATTTKAATTAYSLASEMYGAKTATDAQKNNRNNKNEHSQVYEAILDGLTGFTRALDTSAFLKALKNKKARKIIWHAYSANIFQYFGVVMGYQLSKSIIRQIPSVQSPYLDLTLSVTDLAANAYFLRRSLQMYIHNASYNVLLVKAVTPIMKEQLHKGGCGCSDKKLLMSSLFSPVDYLGKFTTAFVISKLPAGQWLSVPVYALTYGQTLAELTLSDKCTEHRYEIMSNNNAYIFGLGLSLILMSDLLSAVLSSYTNVKSVFIDDAILSVLYQYFIILTMLTLIPLRSPKNEMQPAQQSGFDYFHDVRMLSQLNFDRMYQFVEPRLSNEDKRTSFLLWMKQFVLKKSTRRVLESLAGRNKIYDLIEGKKEADGEIAKSTIEKIANLPDIKAMIEGGIARDFVKLMRKDVRDIITMLRSTREQNTPATINYMRTTPRLNIILSVGVYLASVAFPSQNVGEQVDMVGVLYYKDLPTILDFVEKWLDVLMSIQRRSGGKVVRVGDDLTTKIVEEYAAEERSSNVDVPVAKALESVGVFGSSSWGRVEATSNQGAATLKRSVSLS